MSRLLLALIAVLGMLLWLKDTQLDAALAGKNLANERAEQAQLQITTTELRTLLAERQQAIEELTRENQELRDWARQPLPDAARRLRERPALTGAAAYRDWLSGRNALHAASDGSDN